MWLKSLQLTGFMGISPTSQLSIVDMTHRNVFIGPNNSGKSILFRFMNLLKSRTPRGARENFDKPVVVPKDQVAPSWFWRHHSDTAEVVAEIATTADFSRIQNSAIAREILVNDGECRFYVLLSGAENGGVEIRFIPYGYLGTSWIALKEKDPKAADSPLAQYLSQPDVDREKRQKEIQSCSSVAFTMLEEFSSEMYFVNPIRAIDRDSTQSNTDDGANLLSELFDWQQSTQRTSTFAQFNADLRREINAIFGPCGMPKVDSFRLLPGPKNTRPKLVVTLDSDPGVPMAIEDMGTGIAQLFMILAALVRNPRVIMFIEEPEAHLHPALLRRFSRVLDTFDETQFIIGTHSNILLDGLDECDRVFHFRQGRNGECLATLSSDVTAKHAILDSLGVSGSSLLQTNCTIWVEGPADRLYVRKWLQTIEPELQEGSDYSFVFYCGSILSHFDLGPVDETIDDLISMMCVSRFSAVIMDRDIADSESDDQLNETKRRVLKKLSKDAPQRFAATTQGREVENDVPISVMSATVVEWLGLQPAQVEELQLPGKMNYWDEIIAHVGLDGDDARRAVAKLKQKVTLARRVVAKWNTAKSPNPPPPYMTKLAEFVRRSRLGS